MTIKTKQLHPAPVERGVMRIFGGIVCRVFGHAPPSDGAKWYSLGKDKKFPNLLTRPD